MPWVGKGNQSEEHLWCKQQKELHEKGRDGGRERQSKYIEVTIIVATNDPSWS